jgi:hypothetical protein
MTTKPEDLDRVRVISCTRGQRRKPPKCRWCGLDGKLLCDRDIGEGQTCSAPFCERHGTFLSQTKHLCKACAIEAGKWRE